MIKWIVRLMNIQTTSNKCWRHLCSTYMKPKTLTTIRTSKHNQIMRHGLHTNIFFRINSFTTRNNYRVQYLGSVSTSSSRPYLPLLD